MRFTALKKTCLAGCKLYLILDAGVCDYNRLWKVLRVAVKSGVDIVQLRDKNGPAKETIFFAKRVQAFLAGRIPFIVNDRVDIACLSGASGVHLGQDDLPVGEARRILGSKKIIGVSSQTVGHIQRAVRDGADYVGFGSVFKTLTKPERSSMDLGLLRRAAGVARKASLPLFAIGGIGQKNLPIVRKCGVGRVAVCRDILLANDVRFSVGELRRILLTPSSQR